MITRFAPSPTGHLHLGHAYAAWFARNEAVQTGGQFLLRWEDIDGTRSREEYETTILEDLAWLGLSPDEAPIRQSSRMALYEQALGVLRARDLLYPCFCTRGEIQREIARANEAPQGPDGPLYPGRCRELPSREAEERVAAGEAYALRLRMDRAIQQVGPLTWRDLDHGDFRCQPEIFGDVVLARKDTPTSYHLAVTLDDAEQGIELVTRGEDLLPASHLHRLLQALLALPVPLWRHHRLILDETGKRLAKRDQAASLRSLRMAGLRPADVWAKLGIPGPYQAIP